MLATTCLNQGEGVPIVFLHGFLGSGRDWEEVCLELKDRHCICVDLPGHGKSPFTENFDEELCKVAPFFHLVGYSMGGRLGMGFAERYPERVASISVIGAHFGLPLDERADRLKSDEKWAQMLVEKPIDEFLKQWYDQPIFKTIDRDRMYILRQKQNGPELAKALLFYSLGRQKIYDPKAQLLVGEWDLKFRHLYKEKSPIIIPNAGHAAHLEQPKIVARNII